MNKSGKIDLFFRWELATRADGPSSIARSPTSERNLCCKAGPGPAQSFSGCVTSDVSSVKTGILGKGKCKNRDKVLESFLLQSNFLSEK